MGLHVSLHCHAAAPEACCHEWRTQQTHTFSFYTGTGAITYGSNGVAVLPSIAAQKKKLLWGKKPDPDLPVGNPLILAVHSSQPTLSPAARAAGAVLC